MLPHGFAVVELVVLDLFKVAGSGEVKKQCSVTWQDRQFQWLAIDGEFVLPELDQIAAIGEEFCLISDLLDGVFAQSFESSVQFITSHAVA